MGRILFVFWLVSSCLAWSQEYRAEILILKGGRSIAIQGKFEIVTDEVQFHDFEGNFVTLPLAKVDLQATQAIASEKEQLHQSGPQLATGTYDEVRAYERKQAAEARTELGLGEKLLYQSEAESIVGAQGESVAGDGTEIERVEDFGDNLGEGSRLGHASTVPILGDFSFDFYSKQRQAIGKHYDLVRKGLGKDSKVLSWFVIALIVGIVLAMGAQVYAFFVAFQYSLSWGFALIACFIFPALLSVGVVWLAGELMLMVVGTASLFFVGLFLRFILGHCHGYRLKLLFLWFSPWLVTSAYLGLSLFLRVPLPNLF